MYELELLEKIHSYHEKNVPFVGKVALLKNWEIPIEKVFSGCSTFFDKMYYKDSFIEVVKKDIEEENEEVYFSINTFLNDKQTTDIWHLNAFVLDFDFYKLEKYKGLTPNEMYQLHLKEQLDLEPTAVIDSGNGLYVIYAFKNTSKHCLKLYQNIYKKMFLKFEKYGMDRAAMNVTQVIRVPGTLNPKCNKVVTILEYNDTDYVIQDFSFYLKYSYQEVQEYKQSDKYILRFKKEKKSYTQDQINTIQLNRKSEAKKVVEDLLNLINIRNKNRYHIGYRELLIYIVRERLNNAGLNEKEQEKIVLKVNAQFTLPLDEKEVLKTAVPRAKHKSHKIETIIEKLNINVAEQSKMKYLKTKKMKDREYHKKRNRDKLLSETRKQSKIRERRKKVVELYRKGYKQIQIAEELNLSKGTVSKDIKFYYEHKALYLINYEEYLRSGEPFKEEFEHETYPSPIYVKTNENSEEKLE